MEGLEFSAVHRKFSGGCMQTERDGTQKTRGIYIFGNSRFYLFFKYLRNLKMGNYKILLKYTKNDKNYQMGSNLK